MTEDETRAELIDPKLKACGWGVVEGSKVFRNHAITAGRIQTGGIRGKLLRADYVLSYKGIKLAVIEAKSDVQEVGEGVAQAKQYAEKLSLDTTYSSNGKEIYSICMKTGAEGLVKDYLTPEELWNKTYPVSTSLDAEIVKKAELVEAWREKFSAIPFEYVKGKNDPRYYQEIAVNNTLEAIANNKQRILLTLATGTGKTFIAFQIAWKLFQTRWNLKRDGSRRPRILFLADRNILADQAFNAFSAFPEDALVRISPKEINKKGSVPTNGSIFFTIFQTFMSGASTSSAPTSSAPTSSAPTSSAPTNSAPTNSAPNSANPTFVKRSIDEVQVGSTEHPEMIQKANGYMYILECSDGSFYTGSTKDLERRLEQHQIGEGAHHTKKYSPINLVYYETFDRIDNAFYREKQVQGWSRAKKIALIEGNTNLLPLLSKNSNAAYPALSL